MTVVLGLTDTDELVLALKEDGYDSISDIATMTDTEVEEMSVSIKAKGSDGKVKVHTKNVVKKQRKMLLHLLSWRDWKSRQLQNFELKHWLELSNE